MFIKYTSINKDRVLTLKKINSLTIRKCEQDNDIFYEIIDEYEDDKVKIQIQLMNLLVNAFKPSKYDQVENYIDTNTMHYDDVLGQFDTLERAIEVFKEIEKAIKQGENIYCMPDR